MKRKSHKSVLSVIIEQQKNAAAKGNIDTVYNLHYFGQA